MNGIAKDFKCKLEENKHDSLKMKPYNLGIEKQV